MSELPNRDDFANHLNAKFRVFFDPENATETELIEVSKLREKPRYEAFSLTFLAPNEIPPEQMLYKIEHESLGEMELFLVPVAKDEKGLYFEAVFNREVKRDDGD